MLALAAALLAIEIRLPHRRQTRIHGSAHARNHGEATRFVDLQPGEIDVRMRSTLRRSTLRHAAYRDAQSKVGQRLCEE
jgi:hypothetical protein